jgi:competence/damage-inducible protein CinA-like protein
MSHVTAEPASTAAAVATGGRVEIVTIGDELLLGFTIDTNAAHLARALADLGLAITRRTTVGDTFEDIQSGVRDALERTGAVITTGGLGPTSDDLTKQAIADLFGSDLVVDEAHVAWMKNRWRERFGREMPESNVQQALVPTRGRKLENKHGSALGAWIEDERGRWVAMLPGVPRELRGMTADTLVPLLRDRYRGGAVVRSRTLRTTGIAESLLAERVGDANGITERKGTLAYLPGEAGVDLRVTVHAPDGETADALLARATERLRERAGVHAYGEGDADLAGIVLDKCRAKQATIAVAESCTGGLLGARLTAIAGSSDVVLGGVIAYGNDVKRDLLGVSEDDLKTHGAVSEAVVRQMATGVRAHTKATIGVAITGIAGPSGGTPEKPVGTVWIATDVEGKVEARLLRLIGDRSEIRFRATQSVLEMVRRAL